MQIGGCWGQKERVMRSNCLMGRGFYCNRNVLKLDKGGKCVYNKGHWMFTSIFKNYKSKHPLGPEIIFVTKDYKQLNFH